MNHNDFNKNAMKLGTAVLAANILMFGVTIAMVAAAIKWIIS